MFKAFSTCSRFPALFRAPQRSQAIGRVSSSRRQRSNQAQSSPAAAAGSGGTSGGENSSNEQAALSMQAVPQQEPPQEAGGDVQPAWRSLGTPASELRLEWTLPTGQSFRWRQTGESPLEFTGVVGARAVRLRQLDDDVQYQVIATAPAASPAPAAGASSQPAQQAAGAAAPASAEAAAEAEEALRDYFNLSTRLADLAPGWCSSCQRYASIHPLLPGARMLRQDPVECLFQFICSSNNHIQRIHGMVERLCRRYGTPLVSAGGLVGGGASSAGGGIAIGTSGGDGKEGGKEEGKADELSLYAFPSLEQLAEATEEQLRADGFGYRAKYITGSVAQLLAKPEGGAAWLLGLRGVPYEEAAEALCTLPGIGPKVAACICLFSLDKHQAIPVDVHVWNLATKYYTPHLRGKSLTKKIHGEVQAAFVDRFGPYAGWAHNALFISELASTRDKVPALAAAGGGATKGKAGKRKAQAVESGGQGAGEADGASSRDDANSSQDEAASQGDAGSSYSAELRKEGQLGTAGQGAAAGSPGTPEEGEAAQTVAPRRRSRRQAARG